jgi:peptidoglycan LD-endopeptidase LytH
MFPDDTRSGAAGILATVALIALIGSLLFAGTLLGTGLFTPPAVSATDLEQAQAELDAARAALKTQQDKLDKLAARHADAEASLAATEDRAAEVAEQQARAHADLDKMQTQLQERVRHVYMAGGGSRLRLLETLVSGDISLGELVSRLTLLNKVVQQDQDVFTQVESYGTKLKSLQKELMATQHEQAARLSDLQAANEAAQEALAGSQSEYNQLRKRVKDLEEQQRQQEEAARLAAEKEKAQEKSNTDSNGSSGGSSDGGGQSDGTDDGSSGEAGNVGSDTWVFPVDGPNSFTDTWGAPRSGGRSHEGTDILCSRGTPIRAVVGGRVTQTSPYDTGLGGITIWLSGDDGNSYYYAHMDSIASGIEEGTRVAAGQVIGYAGDTGNARGTVHLHFEIHPGGGGAINSYPTLAANR